MRKRKRQLTPRQQLALAVAAPLLLLAAGWMLVVSPQRSKATSLAQQVAQKQDALQAARNAVLHAPKLPPIRVADIYRLLTAMPDQQDMPGIILQLGQTASEAGITFKSIVPQGTTAGSGSYQVQKIQLDFQGSFYGLSDFLYRLRSLVGVRAGRLDASGRLFSVEQLSFAEGKPAFPQIDAQLTLDAYVYGAAPSATPAPVAPAAGATTTATTTTGATTTGATTTTLTATTTPAAASPTAAPARPGVNG